MKKFLSVCWHVKHEFRVDQMRKSSVRAQVYYYLDKGLAYNRRMQNFSLF